MIKASDLDFWIANNHNVCFRGKHGVGKTAMVLEAFNRHSLKWLYFSASTLDAYVDFVGVPKEAVDPVTGEKYLDLVRPKAFATDSVEAIFLDEFNRAPKKVRNAVMELLQFKSINGKKFNNLKFIWTAINPSDDENLKYDVDELDPAQLDRFHVIVDVPYTPHEPYFTKKYGKHVSHPAISWWNSLSKDFKNSVSPRRLDYALDMHIKGGNIKFVLPEKSNTDKLLYELRSGPIETELVNMMTMTDEEKTLKLLNENFYNMAITPILASKKYLEAFVPYMSQEKISMLFHKNLTVEKFVLSKVDKFESMLQNIADAGTSKKVAKIKNALKKHKIAMGSYGVALFATGGNYNLNNTTGRRQAMRDIANIPSARIASSTLMSDVERLSLVEISFKALSRTQISNIDKNSVWCKAFATNVNAAINKISNLPEYQTIRSEHYATYYKRAAVGIRD